MSIGRSEYRDHRAPGGSSSSNPRSNFKTGRLRRLPAASRGGDEGSPVGLAQLRLHTPLASGADQIAAICARSSGYFVRALLPFEPSEYRVDFADGEELDMFEQALEAADEVFVLPGRRSDVEGAYLAVGESLVQTADILIAIWDGEQARGPGGTANVVDLALKSSTPVIHIHVDHMSDEVRVRALIDGDRAAPFGASIHDPRVYSEVLQSALAAHRNGPGDLAVAMSASC